MISFLRILFLLIVSISYGQKEILLFDSINKIPIEFARIKFIDNNNGTYSNINGKFKINNDIKQISISNIGYETKIVEELNDTIFLDPIPEVLNEVYISNNKTKIVNYKKSKNYLNFTSNSGSLLFMKKFIIPEDIFIREVHLDIENGDSERYARLIVLDDIYSDDINNSLFKSNYVEFIEPNQSSLDFFINNLKSIAS